jgi:hypothetical protein
MKWHPASLKVNIAYGLACGYTQREIGASLVVHLDCTPQVGQNMLE